MASTKTERLNLRVSSDQKHLLEQAAVVVGMSASGFVLEAALADAQAVLMQRQLLVLSQRDSQALDAALTEPPAPAEALRRAVQDYGRPSGP